MSVPDSEGVIIARYTLIPEVAPHSNDAVARLMINSSDFLFCIVELIGLWLSGLSDTSASLSIDGQAGGWASRRVM